jgi:hypothetical protein
LEIEFFKKTDLFKNSATKKNGLKSVFGKHLLPFDGRTHPFYYATRDLRAGGSDDAIGSMYIKITLLKDIGMFGTLGWKIYAF